MTKFKNISLLAMFSLLTVMVLAACGDPTATPVPATTAAPRPTTAAATTAAAAATTAAATTAAATTAAATTAAATTAAATTAAATTAAATTAATTTTAAATTAAAAGKKLKIGLVTDVGRVNDKSFNQSAWEGVQKYQKEFGGDIKYIETTDTKDYAKNIKQFVDEKYDVILTVGFLIGDATAEAATANPGILFIGVDQFQAKDLKNVAGLIFDEDKAGFLIGALAAGMSKSGKIGAVLGTKSVPPVVKFAEGYKAGAAYLDTNYKSLVKAGKTDVTLTYHADGDNAFNDPAWGAQNAQSLIQAGNDIIFGGGGATGNGAVEAGAAQGVYVIGVDTDQYLTLPKAAPKMLSSATKLITDGVYGLLKDASAGKLKGGNNVGPVGLAPFHDTESAIPAELKDVLKKIDAGIKDGSIKTGVKVG